MIFQITGTCLLVANIVLIVACLRDEYRQRSPFFFFWLMLLVVLEIPAASDVISGHLEFVGFSDRRSFGAETIALGQLYVLAIMLLWIVFRAVAQAGRVANPAIKLENMNLPCGTQCALPYIGLVVSGTVALYLLMTQGTQLGALNFVERRETVPYSVIFALDILPKFWIGLALWFLIREQYKTALALVLFVLATFLWLGGSRQGLAQLFIAFGIYVFAFAHLSRSARYTLYGVTAVLAVTGFGFAILLRNAPGLDARLELLALLIAGDVPEHFDLGTGDLRGAFYFFLERSLAIWGDGKFDYFTRTLLWWLPSSLSFGLKPPDFEYEMMRLYTGGDGTLHPTFPGALVADGGWAGLLWVPFIFVVRWLSQIALSQTSGGLLAAGYCAFCISYVMLARGALYSACLVVLSYSFLIFAYNHLLVGAIRAGDAAGNSKAI